MSCRPPRTRADRPLAYLTQERRACPSCGQPIDWRTMFRGETVIRKRFCPSCGEAEETTGQTTHEALAALTRQDATGVYKHTTSTCPKCLALIEAKVVVRDGKVFFDKECPTCGPSQALVSEDADYYKNAYLFARCGAEPLQFTREVVNGCPQDCGLCSDHQQHTCVPLLEVTDYCNLECPICLVDNRHARHITAEEMTRVLDRVIAAEGTLETFALSGGEPTSHPRILELIDLALARKEIGRVVMLTNGLRIAQDRGFAQELKRRGVYVGLQFDGFSKEASIKLRGRDLIGEKEKALALLEQLDVPTQLIFTVARGVNEDQLGKVTELFLSKPHLISLLIQPATYTGQGGGTFGGNPLDRLTIPGVFKAMEEQTGGKLRAKDFVPLPCPSPHCIALTFLLRLNDGGFIPLHRFADLRRYGGLLRNSASLPALPEIEQALQQVIYDLFARPEQDEARPILSALKRAVGAIFPGKPLNFREAIQSGERQVKSIFVHHYMDAHDYDLERVRKCCNHYPQVDGRLMPACNFNMFHRGAAVGPNSPKPAWSTKS